MGTVHLALPDTYTLKLYVQWALNEHNTKLFFHLKSLVSLPANTAKMQKEKSTLKSKKHAYQLSFFVCLTQQFLIAKDSESQSRVC